MSWARDVARCVF